MRREELLPSERARSLKMKYDAIEKKQGYRTDLHIEESNEENNSQTSSPRGKKSDSPIDYYKIYGVRSSSLYRYLNITKLIQPLLDCLDSKKITLKAGSALSSLNEDEQNTIYNYCFENKRNIIELNEEIVNNLKKELKDDIRNESLEIFFNSYKKDKPVKTKTEVNVPFNKLDNILDNIEESNWINYILKALKHYKQYEENQNPMK